MNGIEQATQVAKGISEYGILVMIAAFFLVFVCSILLWNMRNYKTILENLLNDFSDRLKDLQEAADRNSQTMVEIAEGLVPETQQRIKSISGTFFDLATERVCRLIKKVREENHISDREATGRKVRTLLRNMYDDRNSRFDSFTYRGRKLSSYCNPEWVEWVAQAVEGELYNETGANNGRAYTNVCTVYDRIKLDFYHRLNNI